LRSDLQKLRKEREALQEDRSKTALSLHDAFTSDSDDVAKLRLRLGSLLTTLGTQKATPSHLQIPKSESSTIESKAPPLVLPTTPLPMPPLALTPKASGPAPAAAANKTLDALALAQSLFQVGNFQGALQAYRLLPLEGLKAEERVPLQYLMATCLRHLGKFDEAGTLYREVANSRGDEHLAACAQWQLNAVRWQRETTEQLTKIRQRRLALEKQP
jgi:tetratricopeptide (TPR) repeat protein